MLLRTLTAGLLTRTRLILAALTTLLTRLTRVLRLLIATACLVARLLRSLAILIVTIRRHEKSPSEWRALSPIGETAGVRDSCPISHEVFHADDTG
jgi:hypothetical protein